MPQSRLLICSDYFRDRLEVYNKLRRESETKVIQSLFVLNTGVFAAVVGRSTLGPLSHDLLISLFCSVGGILTLLIRAAWSYYRAEFKIQATFLRDVESFNKDELGWSSLYQRDRDRSGRSHLLHGLAILSGVLLLAAAYFGLKGIIKGSRSNDTERRLACWRVSTPVTTETLSRHAPSFLIRGKFLARTK